MRAHLFYLSVATHTFIRCCTEDSFSPTDRPTDRPTARVALLSASERASERASDESTYHIYAPTASIAPHNASVATFSSVGSPIMHPCLGLSSSVVPFVRG